MSNQHVCSLKGCGICPELIQLEKDLRAAQETVRNLIKRRITLKSSRNAIHDHLSNRLPIEIISEIFICHENFNHPSEYNWHSGIRPVYSPALLSGVCRRWREICLSLPNLWTNVYINLWREPVQIAEEWLHRSAALPLYLTLYANEDRRGMNLQGRSATFESVCNVLRSHSARWRYVNFKDTPANSLHVLFRKLEVIPESASFHLRVGRYRHDSSLIRLNTPLRPGRVSIDDVNVYKAIPMEWNNLTHIELRNHPFGQVLDLIRAAPKLRRCDLREMIQSPSKPARPVEHNSLEELDLSFNAPGTDFFQNITFPSLRHLKYGAFSSVHKLWKQFPSDLEDFLVRSELYNPPSLQTFAIIYCHPTYPEHDDEWLFDIKTVTHLTIDHRIVEPIFLKMSEDGSVFPYLQELKFGLFPRFAKGERNPAIQPGPLAVLGDFVMKHNSSARSAAADEVSDHICVNDSPISDQTDVDAIPLKNRRSFKTISVKMYSSYQGERNYIKLRKDTCLILQEAQKSGPLKVNIVTYSKGGEVDVLHDPRCLKVEGSAEDFVVLQSLTT